MIELVQPIPTPRRRVRAAPSPPMSPLFSTRMSPPMSTHGRPSTYESLLGSLLIELWHSGRSVSLASSGTVIASCLGQVRAISLNATSVPNRPPYGVSGTKFGGRKVIQHTASKGLLATGLTPLMPSTGAAVRPWTFIRGRFRSWTTFASLFSLGSPTADVLWIGTDAGTHLSAFFGALGHLRGPVIDTDVHSISAWFEGTQAKLLVDSTLYTTNAPGYGWFDLVTSVAMGRVTTAATLYPEGDMALAMVASAYPGATVAAQIAALAATEFPN